MSLRISSALVLAALVAGCGANTSPEPDGDEIECAIGPGAEFEAVCVLERVSAEEFIVHHPDGGFRRFTHEAEAPVIPSDGAEGLISERISLPGLGAESEPAIYEFGVENASYRAHYELIFGPPDE